MTLNEHQLDEALRLTGDRLATLGEPGPISLYLVGGAGAVLSGLLPPTRTTGDVDVTAVEPAHAKDTVLAAAAAVARDLGLPATWCNANCARFTYLLPVGWFDRCLHTQTYGPLEVYAIHRKDFIAIKIFSAVTRGYDFDDLDHVKPTSEELDFALENIDRAEQEYLGESPIFDEARANVAALRGDS